MTRPADPESKTVQLVAKCKPEWEIEFRAFKKMCARNGFSMSEEIYKRAVKGFLREHNWPPGHSQYQITEFTEECNEESVVVCEVCGVPAVFTCETIFPINPTKSLCRSHCSQFERRSEVISKKEIR